MENFKKNKSSERNNFLDSQKLYDLCIKGDTQAWKYIYQMIKPFFYKMLTGNPMRSEDIDDQIQNFIEKMATNKIHKAREEKAFKTFVYTCARNHIYDFLGSKEPEKAKITDSLDKTDNGKSIQGSLTDGVSFEKEMVVRVIFERIFKKIKIKYPQYHDILRLYLTGKVFPSQKLTIDEIAEKLDMAQGSVGTTIQRGLEKIRKDSEIKKLLFGD